jgi:uncharacterized protein YrrD
MLRSVRELRSTALVAADGPIGDVHDVYFDDREWVVRYYVVDTGKWLPGRKVLIPPHAVRPPLPDSLALPVDLTRQQVRTSPDIDTDRPIERQAEFSLFQHYGWAPYWGTLETPPPPMPIRAMGDAVEAEQQATSGRLGGDPHLRSAKEVIGYRIEATDGEIGHVDDFLLDDQTARIRYAVVDTRNWIPGKHVLIAPQWIREVKWAESKAFVNLTREAVRQSPEYTSIAALDKEYESLLYKHYEYPLEGL